MMIRIKTSNPPPIYMTRSSVRGAIAARGALYAAGASDGAHPLPLTVDATGQVHATTTNVRTLLRGENPAMAPLRDVVAAWIDRHCPRTV